MARYGRDSGIAIRPHAKIDLDVGQRRTGVTAPADAVRLARLIRESRGLRLPQLRGMRDMPKLCAALDRQYGTRSVNSERKVA